MNCLTLIHECQSDSFATCWVFLFFCFFCQQFCRDGLSPSIYLLLPAVLIKRRNVLEQPRRWPEFCWRPLKQPPLFARSPGRRTRGGFVLPTLDRPHIHGVCVTRQWLSLAFSKERNFFLLKDVMPHPSLICGHVLPPEDVYATSWKSDLLAQSVSFPSTPSPTHDPPTPPNPRLGGVPKRLPGLRRTSHLGLQRAVAIWLQLKCCQEGIWAYCGKNIPFSERTQEYRILHEIPDFSNLAS